MKELEKLDFEGNVLFAQKYPKKQAAHLIEMYGTYPNSDKVRWREKAVAKQVRKPKKDEDSQ